MQPSNIRALYPEFENIFETHIKYPRFNGVPIGGRRFRDLKLGVISLWRLLDEHKSLRRETRSSLFQALVREHNFQRALNLLPKRSHSFTRWISQGISSFVFNPSEEESFRYEMNRTAAHTSDSQFLERLENTDDEDLRSASQNAKALAQTELSTLIGAVVKAMTQDVLAMQQDLCERQVRLQTENEERQVLKHILVEFIREINKKSAKGQKSWVAFFFS